jgi:hypothetical protein
MKYDVVNLEPVFFLYSREILFLYNRVICKVTRLGGENAQFQHNKGIKRLTGNENFTKRNKWDPN